ncbi:MAG: Fe-S protein assembly co-chaperone HscB [Rhodospirillales bacterium]|nr:Fe-S protein assembly co-chaperone HscB [Rhodospirillales bacterium]MCW8952430.1 Fe-S protein assembly co-chaperone HscB [Rhodospirillales bacterium]MCW8969951.1 Fe-S protein assembly co-chaperone HscB [Rhodospirillales bacterium]MCW9001534.1 Fe-S protein assembly co-chaperone HscB [Rhodospirillales bacterium]MCW9040335.1 Fe-S protein assembly co-chaperone HscB [Rhodospirillales bacterium]
MLSDQDTPPEVTSGRARMIPCWSCKGPVEEGALFCQTCMTVQPPGQLDHFHRLGVPVGFDVDIAALDREYFSLQRRLHPDRFATRSPRERALSQQQAIALNDSYETLKDPLNRADYLMNLKGRHVLPEGCAMVNDQELLMEAMEMREALVEADTPEAAATLARRAAEDIRGCIAELRTVFDDEHFEQACRLTTRLKYLSKLADEAKARKAQLEGRGR